MKKNIKKEIKKVGELSDQEIKELQAKKAKERVQRVKVKLTKLLEEENCELDISVIVTARGNLPQMNIIAK